MKTTLSCLFLLISLSPSVAFSDTIREDDHLVSNGQGVSSPSFWEAISSQNPAGLTYNTTLKVQGGLSSYYSNFSNLQPSGALLIGNGLLGAGFEYSKTGSAYSDTSRINWGIAGYLTTIKTSIGVTGHHTSGSSSGTFDVGALIHLGRSLTLGVFVPGFTNGISQIGTGLTYEVDRSVDLVVDSGFDVDNQDLTIKPGITVRAGKFLITAAYGIDLIGPTSVIVNNDLTAGLGVKLTNSVSFSYEYKGEPEHRLGLTLKLN